MGTPADLSGWGQKSLYGYSKAVPPPGRANDGGGIGRGCVAPRLCATRVDATVSALASLHHMLLHANTARATTTCRYNTMVVSNKNALGRADGTVNWGGQVGGYLNMMFGTARHRKLLRAVHFGWPKPDMVKWMEPGSFFPIDQMEGDLSETKTAYISLFKTLWTQYRDAVNDACAVVRAARFIGLSVCGSSHTRTSARSI